MGTSEAKEMKVLVKNFPIFFVIFVWFIFSSPYFLFGKVPYSSTYQVNHFFPWSAYEKYWGPVKNGAMPDVTSQIYPWKKFSIDLLKSGELPWWNPYNFSGNPHIANFQSAAFSPFNLIFFVLPFIDAWSVLVLLQPLLAGIFMYLMLRSFFLSREGSLIGAVSFMFCGFIVAWMAYATLGYAILFLPLAIYSVQKFIETKKNIFLILLALTIPLSIFSGHFQISLYFLLALFLFSIFRKSFHSLSAIFLGLIVSLPQILPSLEFYKESVRSGIFISTESIPFRYIATIFAPDFFGNPVTRNDWFGHYAEWTSFIGVIPLIFIFFCNFWKNKNTLFFLILGTASLILALNTPLTNLLVSLKLPVISTSSFSRIIVLTSFAAAALSAFGFDSFVELIKRKFYKKVFIRLALSVLILFFLSLISISGLFSDKLIIALKSLRIPLMLLSAFAVAVYIELKLKLKYFNFVFIILVSLQSLFFAAKWMPFDPKNLVYPQIPVVEAIKNNIGQGRIFGNFGAEFSTYYKFPSIEGYDPLYIGRYGEFIRSADAGEFKEGERSLVKISRRGDYMSRVLDLLGVNLIFHPIADTNQNWAFPVWEDKNRFKLVYQDEKFQLFKNQSAIDRVKLFYSYEVVKDKKQEIKRFYDKDFDFRNKLILEEDPNKSSEFRKNEQGSAEIISYTPNKVIIKAKTASSALLFLSDSFYPNWRASVNGKETKIYRADYSFRAVVLPKGESTVEFVFEPVL